MLKISVHCGLVLRSKWRKEWYHRVQLKDFLDLNSNKRWHFPTFPFRPDLNLMLPITKNFKRLRTRRKNARELRNPFSLCFESQKCTKKMSEQVNVTWSKASESSDVYGWGCGVVMG